MEEFLLKWAPTGIPAALITVLAAVVARVIKNGQRKANEARAAANTALHEKLDVQTELMEKMDSRMDCFEKSAHACQLDNAKTFATKEELGKVWSTVDVHTKEIAILQGAMGHGRVA